MSVARRSAGEDDTSAECHAELAEPRVGREVAGPRRTGGRVRIEQGERGEDARALRRPAAERHVHAGPDQLDRRALLEEEEGEHRSGGGAAGWALEVHAAPRQW